MNEFVKPTFFNALKYCHTKKYGSKIRKGGGITFANSKSNFFFRRISAV